MNTTISRLGNSAFRKTKFLSLMDIYEQNYIHLRNLIPELRTLNGSLVSFVPTCMDLHLSILEQCRYTTIINLTYRFDHDQSDERVHFHRSQYEPNLEIRVYHDAQVAECREGVFHDHVQNSSSVSENKWYLNRFLYKWLAYCLEKGHSFNGNDIGYRYEHSVSRYLLTGYSCKANDFIKQ